MRYLKRRRQTWFARVTIPQHLRATMGREEIVRTLATRDLSVAKRKLHAVLADIQRDIAAAEANVVTRAALSLPDVVKTTVWLRNATDFAEFNESYARYFGELKPARSTVVSALVRPKALVEIEAYPPPEPPPMPMCYGT